MARLTKEQWLQARGQWEADEREGFDWLATELNGAVSRQAISKAAKAQGWVKGGVNVAQQIGEVAQPAMKVAQPNKVAVKVAQLRPKVAEAECASEHKKSNAGRPTDYCESLNDQAYKFCLMGADDVQLAELFEVSEWTINNWKKIYPEFSQSIRAGKAIADGEVAAATFLSATGRHFIVEEESAVDENGNFRLVASKTKQVAASVPAQRMWLHNRQGKHWRERQVVEVEVNLNVVPKAALDEIHRISLEKQRELMKAVSGRAAKQGLVNYIDGESIQEQG